MKTYHLAPVFDPECWFAHEGSLDPLEGRPSLLCQRRCLLVLRLERNPIGKNKSLTFEAKSICVLKVKGSDLSKKERSFGNFKNLVSASKKCSFRARSPKNGATNRVTKFFLVLMTCNQPQLWFTHYDTCVLGILIATLRATSTSVTYAGFLPPNWTVLKHL